MSGSVLDVFSRGMQVRGAASRGMGRASDDAPIEVPRPDANSSGPVAFYGQAVIRWDSAKPLIEAAKQPLPPDVDRQYAIGIAGLPAAVVSMLLGSGLLLMLGATLTVRGHHSQPAAYVGRSGGSGGMIFGFDAAKQPIHAADKQVTFVLNVKGLTLKAGFQPAGMIYRGVLAV